jgi:hypothetical protein
MNSFGGSRSILASCALCVVAGVAAADDKRLLSDAELDATTAGSVGINVQDEQIVFEVVRKSASGRRVRADGSLRIIEVPAGITVGNLILSDNAQQNLHSLININAVNSAVNVLLNLNITVDSSVGTVNQLNWTDSLPAVPPLLRGP